jgi:hypothetical protein
MTEQAAAATEPQPMTIAQAAESFAKLNTSPEPEKKGQPEQEGEATTPDEGTAEEGQEPQPAPELEDGEDRAAEEEAPEDSDDDALVEVTLEGGEKSKVTLKELARSYATQAAQTKKSMADAEARKAVQAEQQQVQQVRAQYMQRLGELEQFMQQQEPQISPEQWAEWESYDPARFAAEKIKHQERQARLGQVRAEREALARQAQAEQYKALTEFMAEQPKILQRHIPEAADPAKWAAKQPEIRAYLKEIGYTDAEVDGFYDARAVTMAYQAMQHRKAQEKRPIIAKKLAEAPRMVSTSAPPSRHQRERAKLDAAAQKLAKTGSIRDAANYFSQIKL